MSQEQKSQLEPEQQALAPSERQGEVGLEPEQQVLAPSEHQGEVGAEPAPAKRSAGKAVKVTPESEAAISPRPSFWPVLLALLLSLALLGLVRESIIIVAIGVLGVVGTAIGWALERR